MAHAKATKHSVKKVDFMKHSSGNETKSNEEEDLFARLEELERQEEMNNELKNEEYFANSACNTKCDDENTHDTSRVARMKNASSDVRACSEKERAPTTCTVNEQNNSLRAAGCVFEDKRAANACPMKSEQNDTSDTCNITEATNLNDSDKHLAKKVSWKENIVEKQEDGVVTNPKHGNTTIYFTHSARTVGLSISQSNASDLQPLTNQISPMYPNSQSDASSVKFLPNLFHKKTNARTFTQNVESYCIVLCVTKTDHTLKMFVFLF
jgi:transcriptional regulator with PAS, ATPase and Fis domain